MEPSARRSPVVACTLAWLWPGAGHLYAGSPRRGIGFLLALGTLFGLGVAMHARLAWYFGLEDPLALLRSLSQMALGAPYVLARALVDPAGVPTSPMHEYGNTFTEVAGLLNVLVALDARDVALGRRS